MQQRKQVIIGVDPHKLSATIEVVDRDERMLGSGRFSTHRAGYKAMRTDANAWPDRVWAVEGANRVGRPLAQRLLEAGEQVVDVPAKLAARVRLFETGHNRKTDTLDAHSIAIVAVRTTALRVLRVDGELEALRMLPDRREALTRRRVQTLDRPQALLAELLPGQAKRDITTGQTKAMLASVRPRDIAGNTRRRIAGAELARAGRDQKAGVRSLRARSEAETVKRPRNASPGGLFDCHAEQACVDERSEVSARRRVGRPRRRAGGSPRAFEAGT